jgi:ubiquitin C-terminal hydrolase
MFNAYFLNDSVHDWTCDDCHIKHNEVLRARKISKMPKTLMIAFKRFNHLGIKNYQSCELLETLEIDDCIKLYDEPYNYKLVSIGCHYGSLYRGHYFACSKLEDTWYVCDDENITEIGNLKDREQNTPYMLFYQQVQ